MLDVVQSETAQDGLSFLVLEQLESLARTNESDAPVNGTTKAGRDRSGRRYKWRTGLPVTCCRRCGSDRMPAAATSRNGATAAAAAARGASAATGRC